MEAWERFLDAVKLNKNKCRVPIALLGTPRFYASLANVNLFECLHDPCKMMDVQLQAFRKFPEILFIPGCWPDYGVGLLSAFGCKISWGSNAMPSILEPYIKTEADIYQLSIPNPEAEGLMPWHLKSLTLFAQKKEFHNNLHFIHANGPGELAGYLWGLENLLLNFHLNPQLTKELLEKMTESVIIWLRAQAKILNNAECVIITDDISGLVSPETYKEYLYPLHLKIRKEFENYIYVFHCDTKSDSVLEIFPEVGIDVFNFGPTTDFAVAKSKIGDKICLMGNLDPVSVMQSKDESIVKSSAEKCLQIAKGQGGYLLSAGGGLNENTPKENIRALIEVTRGHFIT
jgi:uroporphyrinogen decarboxylase